MKKYFVVILLTLMLCGCTAEYNLDISNNSFKENISVNINNSEIPEKSPYPEIESDDLITPFLNNQYSALFSNEDALYDKKETYYDDYIDVKMKYKYTEEEFNDSNSLKLCFDNYEFLYKDYYYINAYGTFYCLYTDEMDINIKTNNKVTFNNADSVKGNVYTWHIDKTNMNDINIKIEMKKGISRNTILNYALIICVIIIILGAAFVVYKKRIRENKL